MKAAKQLYPHASIWLTGHSLGGSVASLLGIAKNYPVFTYSSPGDVRYGQKVGLIKPNLKESDLKKMPVWQFGHTGTLSLIFAPRSYLHIDLDSFDSPVPPLTSMHVFYGK